MHFTPQLMQMKPNLILNLIYLFRFNLKLPHQSIQKNNKYYWGLNKKKVRQAKIKFRGAASAYHYKLWPCTAAQPVKSFTQSDWRQVNAEDLIQSFNGPYIWAGVEVWYLELGG